ncbi:helix-turn-helix domain-containing protein [Candidatus Riflebacteria bacterium]
MDKYNNFCTKIQFLSGGENQLQGRYVQGHQSLNLYLDEPVDSKVLFPLPDSTLKGRKIIEIPVKPRIALAFYLWQLRLKMGLTQREVAEKMGLKNLYSYQRLESSKTANPALETLVLIKKVFPEFRADLLISC